MAAHGTPVTPSPRAPFDMASLQMNLPFVKNSGQEEIDKLMGRLTIRDIQGPPSPTPAARHGKKSARGVDNELGGLGDHARPRPCSRTTTPPPNSQLLGVRDRCLTTRGTEADMDAILVPFSQVTVRLEREPTARRLPTTPRATTPERAYDHIHDMLKTQISLQPTSPLLDPDVGKSPRKSPARKTLPSTPTRRRSESGSKPEFASASPVTPSSTRWSPYACPRFPPGMSSESPTKRARSLRSVSDSFASQGLSRSLTAIESNFHQSGTFSAARRQNKPTFASGSRARCTACEFPTMALRHTPPCHLAPADTPDISPSKGNLYARMKGCPACDFPGIGYTHSQACDLSHPSPMDVDSQPANAHEYTGAEESDFFGPI